MHKKERFKAAVKGTALVFLYFILTVILDTIAGALLMSLSLEVLKVPNPGAVQMLRISAAITFTGKFIASFFKGGE